MAERHRKDKADRHPPKLGVYLRLRPEVMERVREEADARDVSVSWIVNRLVIEGLDRLVPVADMLTVRRPTEDTE